LKELVVNQLKIEYNKLQGELEKLEGEISDLSHELSEEKKIKKLARIIYAKNLTKVGENFMRQNNFEMIEKKLAKKNAELQ
jgi:DNA gyrase/topoisomerase IV subunit A